MYMIQCTSVLFRLHDVMCMQAAFYPVFCDFAPIAVRLTKWRISPVLCYLLCSVGIEYSCGMSVM